MTYCPRCGIQNGEGHQRCASCATPLPLLEQAEPLLRAFPVPEAEQSRFARRFVWQTGMLVLMTATASLLAIDLGSDGVLAWSVVPLAALVLAAALWTTLVYLYRHPLAWSACLMGATALFLAFVDSRTPGRSWFPTLGLPISATVLLMAYPARKLWPPGRKAPYIALLLAMGCLTCMAIDMLTHLWGANSVTPGWSLIVAGATVPAQLFLLIYDRQRRRLERYFHI